MIIFNFLKNIYIFFLNSVHKFFNFLSYKGLRRRLFLSNISILFCWFSLKFLSIISFFLYYIMLLLGDTKKGFFILNIIRVLSLFFIKYIINNTALKKLIGFIKFSYDVNSDKKDFLLVNIDSNLYTKKSGLHDVIREGTLKFFEFDIQSLNLINFEVISNKVGLVSNVSKHTKDVLVSKVAEDVSNENTIVVVKSVGSVMKDTISSALIYTGEVLSLHTPFIVSSIVLLGLGITSFLIVKQIEYALFQQDYLINSVVDFKLLKKYDFVSEDSTKLKQISSILTEYSQGRFFKEEEDFVDFLGELSAKLIDENKMFDSVIVTYVFLKVVDNETLQSLIKKAEADHVHIFRVIKDSYYEDFTFSQEDELKLGAANALMEFFKSGDYLD